MNQKLSDRISLMKDRITLEKIKQATGAFSKQQKMTVGGTVGVLALAAMLSIAPVPTTHMPMDAGSGIQTESLKMAKSDNDTQWLIKINGSLILAVDTEEEAKAVFEGVKSYYVTPGAQVSDIQFGQEFSYVPYDYQATGGEPAWVMSVPDAIDYIVRGTTQAKTYVVQGGDTLWDIAKKCNISPTELENMNPGINTSSLKIGSVLNLYDLKPFVTVRTTETVVATETVPYTTVYEESSQLYKGQTKVQTAGVSGSKQVTSQVIKENGIVLGSNVLSETVLSQPQNQVSLKGTAAIPTYTGASNGILGAPMAHVEVSSAFGTRGGGRHYGVDLRNPQGTPFGAAADGVVTCASYSGTYGNIIKVDHGGGLQTYYAHCDSMYVSVGDKVTKGQTLGTVGRTGNATGYVLHFEVRINGVAQNPMNYI
ncbi:M23 family metallopeptidase [Clostridium aminobutyricum]|uniref:M23 family metallopeptidase n=1 Tax=Clostridium aminobutyricum TaxID=33953 RepID=A0A939DAZ8_CLOAM|nr:M23 family metallopeptidase [Clostridium aminobutyricum]MBN7774426.1 M23 family metallopeptidase [Clostridium aminobutyricum]